MVNIKVSKLMLSVTSEIKEEINNSNVNLLLIVIMIVYAKLVGNYGN